MSTGKKDYQELRKTFYECRNFEINNLWQKSVLLTAFIVLTFTIYATILSKLFDINDLPNKILIHEICSGISLIGLIFAIIWIMMGKGSKAWYELYENAICTIEREKKNRYTRKICNGKKRNIFLSGWKYFYF